MNSADQLKNWTSASRFIIVGMPEKSPTMCASMLVVLAAPRERDGDDAGEAVGDQQPAEQVHLLFERPLLDADDDERRPRRSRSGSTRRCATASARIVVSPSGWSAVSPNAAISSGEYSLVVTTVQSTARNSAAPPIQKA